MSSNPNILAELKTFLVQELHGQAAAIDIDTDLIETGVLDSISFVALVSFIEKRVGRWLPVEELGPENFVSLRSMHNLLIRIDAVPQGAPSLRASQSETG